MFGRFTPNRVDIIIPQMPREYHRVSGRKPDTFGQGWYAVLQPFNLAIWQCVLLRKMLKSCCAFLLSLLRVGGLQEPFCAECQSRAVNEKWGSDHVSVDGDRYGCGVGRCSGQCKYGVARASVAGGRWAYGFKSQRAWASHVACLNSF